MSTPAVEDLLRTLAPRVLGTVARKYRDFESAEDAVQEALIAAAHAWPRDGVPDSPEGWLVTTASRRLLNIWRADDARRRRESLDWPTPQDGRDDSLELLFLCCHEALTPPSAIALTLRAVGGLSTAEIAAAFLVPEATMAQRISRAKATILASGVPFTRPDTWRPRLAAVLHVLYLMFTEAYAGTSAPGYVRPDLSREAIRLTRGLRHALPREPEVAGLLALMLLTDARRAARVGPHGELIPLDEQDRGRWDAAAIEEGTRLTDEAFASGAVGAYQLQAAIAALHDAAPSTADTDWAQIAALYGVLERMQRNPMVTLNRAVALAMVRGPAAGLSLLDTVPLTGHHRWHAVRGQLLAMAGDRAAAVEELAAAARLTTSGPERDYLLTKAAGLRLPSAP
ncbi:RNA polymerase sigma factor [Hamadaea tsunoensis]|uniref:RNA polymerase sigma factor n=1 Tax=Hamadaea tsunoensis TaxID=53368 RepID=UPI0004106311|nr:DUF6596 domain-containing protein [Hamadaea tsunoensis]